MVRVRAKIQKKLSFKQGFGKKRAKIEKNTLLGRALVRVRAKNEKKHTLFGMAWVRVRAKVEKTPFLGMGFV